MSLKEVNIKIKYDSDEDDLLNDFYIPILSQANEYYRLSGFFNSSSLAVSACGLENFIKNNGKMKLVTSVIFSENDTLKKMKQLLDYYTSNQYGYANREITILSMKALSDS